MQEKLSLAIGVMDKGSTVKSCTSATSPLLFEAPNKDLRLPQKRGKHPIVSVNTRSQKNYITRRLKSKKFQKRKICEKCLKCKNSLVKYFRKNCSDSVFRCVICKQEFSHSSDFYCHADENNDCGNNREKRSITQRKLGENMTKHVGKSYECTKCKKSFPHRSSLEYHLRSHTGERPFRCDVCEKRFFELSHLTRHSKLHTGDRPHKCAICGKSFIQAHFYRQHMQRHSGDLPFHCEICEKGFAGKSHLKDHMRSHTGERLFKCDVCQKFYSSASACNKHKRVFHGDRKHGCPECPKSFSLPEDLEKHLRVHSGERPFQCEVCQKGFIGRKNLKDHMRIHSAATFSCQTCQKTYSSTSNLRKHVRMQHGQTAAEADGKLQQTTTQCEASVHGSVFDLLENGDPSEKEYTGASILDLFDELDCIGDVLDQEFQI